MAELKIGKITMGMCQTNCYFVYEEGEKEVLFFDPADRGDYLYEVLKENGFSAMLTDVLAIRLNHRVGQLQELLEVICKSNIIYILLIV